MIVYGLLFGEACTVTLSMPLILQEAPDFVLRGYYNSNEVRVKLSDFRGKWIVLFFYLSDFSTV